MRVNNLQLLKANHFKIGANLQLLKANHFKMCSFVTGLLIGCKKKKKLEIMWHFLLMRQEGSIHVIYAANYAISFLN